MKSQSEYNRAEERPQTLPNITVECETGEGKLFVIITHDEDFNPVEIFLKIGKMGSETHAAMEALGRSLSRSLRSNLDPMELAEDLIGIKSTPHYYRGLRIESPQDAAGQILKSFVEDHRNG